MGESLKCIEKCDEVLKLDTKNVKALYRKAQVIHWQSNNNWRLITLSVTGQRLPFLIKFYLIVQSIGTNDDLVQALLVQNDIAEALELLNKLLEVEPNNKVLKLIFIKLIHEIVIFQCSKFFYVWLLLSWSVSVIVSSLECSEFFQAALQQVVICKNKLSELRLKERKRYKGLFRKLATEVLYFLKSFHFIFVFFAKNWSLRSFRKRLTISLKKKNRKEIML